MENLNENPTEKFKPQIPKLDLTEQGDMLIEFTAETLNLLVEAKNAILALESVPNDSEALNSAFKVFYTIKGLAIFLNLQDIQVLSRAAEELFDLLRKELLAFDEEVMEIAFECVDSLRALVGLLHDQISNQGELSEEYFDVTMTLERIEVLKERAISQKIKKIIFDKKSGKEPAVSLPISRGDGRARMLKRQQELIKERELAVKLAQQAQRSAAEKSEMLSSMAHEMRTLINAILGFSDLLIKSPLEEKQKNFLSSIHSSADLLLEVINNILDLAKVEKGKLKFEKLPFHLEELIEDVFRIIRTRLEGKSVLLFYDIPKEIPRGLRGDPTRLRQILINLLSNAVKFTEKGHVGLVLSLVEDPGNGHVVLQFKTSDTGIGIPKSRHEYIFESFTQGDKSISREYGGTGLGLTISKSYVEAMGGRIWVESQVGKGSDFYFTMSFPLDEDAGLRQVLQLPVDALKGKFALIVDKQRDGVLPGLCEKLNIQTNMVDGSAKEIFEVLKKSSLEKTSVPDIIFINTLNNRDEGYLLANKIKNHEPLKHVKLVAASADIRIGVSSEAFKECFDDFLVFPIIENELTALLQKLFNISSTLQGPQQPLAENASCEGIKVLIVDDSLTNLELIKAYFETMGCEGDYATNGQEAIEMIKEKQYDICFLDLQMPIMNGFAAAQIIRQELKKDLPIVALTAADAQEDKDRCREIGFNDFLMKPFNMDDFQNKIITYGRK